MAEEADQDLISVNTAGTSQENARENAGFAEDNGSIISDDKKMIKANDTRSLSNIMTTGVQSTNSATGNNFTNDQEYRNSKVSNTFKATCPPL